MAGARALPQRRCSGLEIPSSLAYGERSGFLRCLELQALPAQMQQHRRARSNAGWAWGSYLPPLSTSPNRDSRSSLHSEPQRWHRHLLLLAGRESHAAGRPQVSCSPAP